MVSILSYNRSASCLLASLSVVSSSAVRWSDDVAGGAGALSVGAVGCEEVEASVLRAGSLDVVILVSLSIGPVSVAEASGSIETRGSEVSVGTSWSDETNEQGMSVQTTYTVAKIENGKVYIDITGVVTGMGEGEVTGNLLIDIKTGIQDTANLEMAISASGVDMKISTKTTTTKL